MLYFSSLSLKHVRALTCVLTYIHTHAHAVHTDPNEIPPSGLLFVTPRECLRAGPCSLTRAQPHVYTLRY